MNESNTAILMVIKKYALQQPRRNRYMLDYKYWQWRIRIFPITPNYKKKENNKKLPVLSKSETITILAHLEVTINHFKIYNLFTISNEL